MWPGCYRAEERLDPGKTRRGVAAERTKGKGWGWGTPWGAQRTEEPTVGRGVGERSQASGSHQGTWI